jgi:RNA polymerase sigma factor (sigma-70 family)
MANVTKASRRWADIGAADGKGERYKEIKAKCLDLVRRYQGGDREAGGELIGIVKGMLKLLARKCMESESLPEDRFDDLMQEGAIGILEAARRYDLDAETTFMSYAKFWARLQMSRSCSIVTDPYEIPAYAKHARVKSRHGSAMTSSEATAAKILDSRGVERLADLLEIGADVADRGPHAAEADFPESIRCGLARAVGRLADRDWEVISMRLGLDGREPKWFVEIGERYGVGREMARQYYSWALDRLRGLLAEEIREIPRVA